MGDPRFVGHEDDALYRVRFDGSISDEQGFCVIGGNAEPLESHLQSRYEEGMSLADALRTGREALARADNGDPDLSAGNLEVCVLERERLARRFHRLSMAEIENLIG